MRKNSKNKKKKVIDATNPISGENIDNTYRNKLKPRTEIKNQVKIGDYSKAAKSKENLQKFETALKDDPFFGKFSLEKYIMSWIGEKYPDFTGYFAGANFGQLPKIGYSLNALANHNNTTLELLVDEFVEWYKENFDGYRKF